MLSSGPGAPSAGSQSGSNPDPLTGSEAASDVTRVETVLAEEKTVSLRSELGQIAQAYPATYGVVASCPSPHRRTLPAARTVGDDMPSARPERGAVPRRYMD